MPKEISSIARLILERAATEGTRLSENRKTTILSCGGMYLARSGQIPPTVYHVLNLANQKEPIKIYVGRRGPVNQLHRALAKEAMN